MDAEQLDGLVCEPALWWLRRYGPEPTLDARRLLLAIALHVSGCGQRELEGGRGYWGLRRDMLAELLRSRYLGITAGEVCSVFSVDPDLDDVFEAVGHNDLLGCALARLLVWEHSPRDVGDPGNGWNVFLKLWKPAMPDPSTWEFDWSEANFAMADRISSDTSIPNAVSRPPGGTPEGDEV